MEDQTVVFFLFARLLFQKRMLRLIQNLGIHDQCTMNHYALLQKRFSL